MKTLFIEAARKLELNAEKLKELEKSLPNTIYIAYSIQYKELAEQVRKVVGKKVLGFSQVLGCSELKTKAEAILLIGNAHFHALNLALTSGKEVIIFDNYSISRITKQEIESMHKREKGKYLKFLASSEAGILISSKLGQENLKLALNFKKDIESKGKKAYLFLADNINPAELENFPLDIYVNTACSGLALDSNKIINIKTINNAKI